jgi:eukaryotic-like serine/threonine-protein kinase
LAVTDKRDGVANKCPKCHFDNPSDTKFCGSCATPLHPTEIGEIGGHQPDSPESGVVPPDLKTQTLQLPVKELTTGSTFAGRYQIIEELGKGGMGKVYKVFDTDIREKVALKLLKPEIASDKETIERFSNELKYARKISHRNVCRMYDLGKAEGTYFITMEYVAGEDLRSFIRRSRQLTVGTATAIAKQVCEGLAEAHRLGVVHRDLKPGNIMIDKDGDAHIMDFGIAKSLQGKGITGAGVMIGTPEYMSPEQVEGKEADPRSDIYSLGVCLYEMIAGRVPFEGETPLSVAVKHKSEIPRDPEEFNPQISEDLSRLILKCLAKDREKRYQTAEELQAELSRVGTSRKEEIGRRKGEKSIAVLAFTDLSAKKDQEFFCDGIAEEIISSLARIRSLRVVARTSAFSFKGKDMDVREIGQKLNVETVLEGSVRKAEKKLRITADLINVADGFHLWSERYDCELDDIFAVQDNVTRAIIEKLKIEFLEVNKAGLARPQTKDMDAYDLYLRGRYFWNQRTEEGLAKAIHCFERAIKIDPGYALAHAGLAESYVLLCWYSSLPPHQVYPKAKASALTALDSDPNLAEAHAALGYYFMHYDRDWLAAEKEFKRAIESNRGYAFARQGYFQYLAAQERMDEALSEVKKAVEIDPLSLGTNSGLALGFYFSRQYDRAIEQSRKTLELNPDMIWAQYVLGVSFIKDSKPAKTIEEFQKSASFSDLHPLTAAVLGAAYARQGEADKMEEILSHLLERARHGYIMPFYIAIVYLGLGQNDKTFEWLEKACEERNFWLIFLKADPMYDSVRSDRRFLDLLRKMNLNQ